MHDGIVIALFITAAFAIMAAAEWVILRLEKRTESSTENDELLELINFHARSNRIQREQDQAILDKATRFRADFS